MSYGDAFAFKNRELSVVEKQTPEIVFPEIRASLKTPSFTPAIESNSSGSYTFSSSNETIATVSDGKITIVGMGTVIITATQESSGNYFSSTVTTSLTVYNDHAFIGEILGQDIDGEAPGDQLGRSVSLSSDGKTVAIGAPFNDGKGSDAGQVRVYSLINYSPITSSITRTVTEQETSTINLTAIDVDSGQSSITFSIVNAPLNGTASISGTSVLYTSTSDTAITDVFTYKANDGNTDSNVSTVTIIITAVDEDSDGDGILNSLDNCPSVANASQADADSDGIGDNADTDDNNDGFEDKILFPSGVLTPNSSGLESTWKIINIEKYPNARVRVYDKNGQEVFSKANYTNDWRGTFKTSSKSLPAGPYYYMIDLANGEDPLKGWLYLTY